MGRELREALRTADELVFVCSGNMVRSAFAELYARHLGCAREVRSVATTYRNDGLFPETRRALLARGLAPATLDAFRSTHLEDLRPPPGPRALFLAMTRSHVEALTAGGVARGRIHLLGELEGATGGADIADPVLEGADFDATFARVARLVEVLLAELDEDAAG